MTVGAILVAAGPGSRLGAPVPKAFIELGGCPLMIRALRGLLEAPSISAERQCLRVAEGRREGERQPARRHVPDLDAVGAA